MNILFRYVCHCVLAVLAAAPCVGSAEAAVVTKRLATALPPSPTAGQLPEAWVRPATNAPKLDGRLDDQVWTTARPIVLGKLERYGTTSPRTDVLLIHKDGVLYVGARLAEPRIADLERSVTQADGPAYQDDSLELFLSPFPDRGYFQIILNAWGWHFRSAGPRGAGAMELRDKGRHRD